MKSIIAGIVLSFAFAGASQAMPLASAPVQSVNVTTIAAGCGAGWHRGPRGRCVRNFEHPTMHPAMHPCPRGFHLGPHGKCRANGR